MDASIIGRSYPAPGVFTVTRPAVEAFAAVVSGGSGGDSTAYDDVDLAPPTFPIVAVFPAMTAFLETEGIELARVIHGEQHFTSQRPVRVGDRLSVTLTVDSLRTIGGNDVIATTSVISDESGAPVCTGKTTLVHRGADG